MTTREKVVELRAQGLGYNQISEQLGVTKSTVSWHASEQNRNTCRAARSRNRAKARDALKAKAGGKCSVCGYNKCQAALQFHHVDPSSKTQVRTKKGVLFSVTSLITQKGVKAANKEAAKCVLLCANCHAELHALKRISASAAIQSVA